ncbi:hypothetical protein M0804_014270 [Polistes exclamans]|nr:hypothetical protein M0804_014273 [Polistes exclamans]KAI4475500.1 hypothetical protein M0804_014270 [Polistes exclamans]
MWLGSSVTSHLLAVALNRRVDKGREISGKREESEENDCGKRVEQKEKEKEGGGGVGGVGGGGGDGGGGEDDGGGGGGGSVTTVKGS